MTRQGTAGNDVPNGQPTVLAPEFVGRDEELGALTRTLADGPAVVLIEGEAGIGKSRLLAECLAVAGDGILVADCPPFRQPQTLGPVVDAIRKASDSITDLTLSPLAGALRPLFPEWAAELPEAPEPAEDASAARHRLFRALAEMLAALRVTVLAVEDAHSADDATLEFLLFLAFRQPQLSLIVTYRPDDIPAGSLLPRLTGRPPAGASQLRLTLRLLDTRATGQLVSSMLAGEHVSEQFAAFVHEHTEGMPLAIEETIRLMADRADLTRRPDGWVRRRVDDIAVPASIRDAVLERAGRLDDGAQSVLRAAAVLMEPAGEATVASVARLTGDEVLAGLSAALGSGLLQTSQRGLISFRHVLAARAMYDAIPVPERRAMHLRAGQALETVPAGLTQLARHFRETGEAGKWCEYAERAADLAVASGDEATAMTLVDDLMADAGRPGLDSSLRLIEKLSFGTLADPVWHLEKLVSSMRASLSLGVLAPREEAIWRLHLGRALATLDEWGEARAEFERAIPGLDPVRAARAMTDLAWPFDTSSAAASHLVWLARAAEVSVQASFTAEEWLRLLVLRCTSLLLLSEDSGWDEAAKIPAHAATSVERQLITLGHQNAGHLAVIWGRYAAAADWLDQAHELAQAHGYLRHLGNVEVTRAHLDWFTGSWEGLAGRVRALADGMITQPAARQETDLITGLLAAATGDRAEAVRLFRAVVAEDLRRSAAPMAMEPAAALARIYLDDERPGEALAVTSGLASILVTKNFWASAGELGPAHTAALLAVGRADDAAVFVAAFEQGMARCSGPAARAALTLSRALLAEAGAGNECGAELFGAAADAWQAMPRPYDALLARERQGRCLAAAGQAEDAQAMLSEVMRGLARLGATADADRVARALREAGVQARRPGGGRPGYGSQLSPRELEVVRLVADGQTNRQIAESLFLSPKTVATHVDAAMRKLSVSSRTALAVTAVTTGIVIGQPSLPNRQPLFNR
jgi:DNA-binding CsgD family transcriptional regulator